MSKVEEKGANAQAQVPPVKEVEAKLDLEEDDYFEEFQQNNQDILAEEAKNLQKWQDDWEEDALDGDFETHLKGELA